MNKKLLIFVLLAIGLVVLVSFASTLDKSNQENTAKSTHSPTASLAVDELLKQSPDLIGKTVSVKGKVLFDSVCPPSMPDSQEACVTKAYLVTSETTFIESSTQKLPLFKQEKWVSCKEPLPANMCEGWESGQDYEVRGVLKYLVASGKPTNTLILETSEN